MPCRGHLASFPGLPHFSCSVLCYLFKHTSTVCRLDNAYYNQHHSKPLHQHSLSTGQCVLQPAPLKAVTPAQFVDWTMRTTTSTTQSRYTSTVCRLDNAYYNQHHSKPLHQHSLSTGQCVLQPAPLKAQFVDWTMRTTTSTTQSTVCRLDNAYYNQHHSKPLG